MNLGVLTQPLLRDARMFLMGRVVMSKLVGTDTTLSN
jgi:hypothetical protein